MEKFFFVPTESEIYSFSFFIWWHLNLYVPFYLAGNVLSVCFFFFCNLSPFFFFLKLKINRFLFHSYRMFLSCQNNRIFFYKFSEHRMLRVFRTYRNKCRLSKAFYLKIKFSNLVNVLKWNNSEIIFFIRTNW